MAKDCDPCGGTGYVATHEHGESEMCEGCWGTGYDVGRRLDAYRTALLNEVGENSFKGSWLEGDDPVEELLYHAFKLALAHGEGNVTAVLHYAADVGNHAWFMADLHGALTKDPLPLVRGSAIEYTDDGLRVPPHALAKLKREARQLADHLQEVGNDGD